MKLIQSYWFKPFTELTSSRFRGGFPSPRHFWSSLALSCVLAREAFGAVEFHTDAVGAELVAKAGIPYDRVVTTLNELPNVPIYMWAYGKMVVCGQQREPFLHLDTDFFLFRPLPADLLQQRLIVQSVEFGAGHEQYYRPAILELSLDLNLPDSIRAYLANARPFRALNCGMIGGSDTDFLSSTLGRATRIIDSPTNTEKWSLIGKRNREHREAFNCVLEQLLLAFSAEDSGITPAVLFDLGADQQAPRDDDRYLHLVGKNKFEANLLQRMERELIAHAPRLAERIKNEFP